MRLATPKRPRISPLRYPGGKAALFPLLRTLIRSNLSPHSRYVEPYAGGAGAALALLTMHEVDSIVINDLDPNVHAFWASIVFDNARFVDRLERVELSLEEWQRQKNVLRTPGSATRLDLGFATFYLNRTNRSGVLNGGPIGGIDQTGSYKIDARFNREELINRIRLIGRYAPKITVRNADGIDVITEFVNDADTLIYADPPYFEKAGSLYLNSFRPNDHEALANCLNRSANANWLLTYDNVSQVNSLYGDRLIVPYSLHYSAHRVAKVTELMVYSDALRSSATSAPIQLNL